MDKIKNFCILILLFPAVCYASGDPAVVYWVFAAAVLQICVLVFVVRLAKKRLMTFVTYIFAMVLLWYWALDTNQLSYTTVEWILTAAPILVGLICFFVARKIR